MPVLTTADVTLVDRGGEVMLQDNDGTFYNSFQMDRYAIEAQIHKNKIHRLIPNRSRALWEAQDPDFIEQLKTLFVSQYIAGQRLVVE